MAFSRIGNIEVEELAVLCVLQREFGSTIKYGLKVC